MDIAGIKRTHEPPKISSLNKRKAKFKCSFILLSHPFIPVAWMITEGGVRILVLFAKSQSKVATTLATIIAL